MGIASSQLRQIYVDGTIADATQHLAIALRLQTTQEAVQQGLYLVLRPAEEGACPRIEERVGPRHRGRRLLRDLVAQVLDQDLVGALVQHREPVASDEHGRGAAAPLGVLQDKPQLNSAFLSHQRAGISGQQCSAAFEQNGGEKKAAKSFRLKPSVPAGTCAQVMYQGLTW